MLKGVKQETNRIIYGITESKNVKEDQYQHNNGSHINICYFFETKNLFIQRNSGIGLVENKYETSLEAVSLLLT